MGLFNFKKKNNRPDSIHENSNIVGVYSVLDNTDVKLIEIIIEEQIDDFDPSSLTQQGKSKDKLDWQTAYNEKYLNLEGIEIIGDDFNLPIGLTKFRLVFFFHFLDLNKPLISQYGLIKLVEESELPERLKNIIKYEQVD